MHVLAHQGGWDELLWFALPIALVMLWMRWAERSARARSGPPTPDSTDSAGETAASTLPPHHDH